MDADNAEETAALIRKTGAKLLINVALPYQDLNLMDACLLAGCDYMDTANYEPKDVAKFEYSWQWAYQERFEKAGLSALLGSGFDPGVTNVFTAWALKHHFDEIHTLDIIDVNGGNHGKAFATNFNPEINIREVTAECRHFENGEFVETPPMSQAPGVHLPGRRRHLRDLPDVSRGAGIAGETHPHDQARAVLDVVLAELLEAPRSASERRHDADRSGHLPRRGNHPAAVPQGGAAESRRPRQVPPRASTCIGNVITGLKDGKSKAIYIYNICDHEACFAEVGSQAISYTTGVPAMIGAKQMLAGDWRKPGVWNIEQHDPDAFMADLNVHGLPWQFIELTPEQAAAFQVV